jgi:putative FmdB family regulatory protein
MPLYEYKCRTCDKVFEVMQKFADAPLTTHEGCGGEVDRLISTPAFQFKGSGFYITDYKKNKTSSGGSHKNNESAKKDSGSGSDAKPSTAPAATSSDKKS